MKILVIFGTLLLFLASCGNTQNVASIPESDSNTATQTSEPKVILALGDSLTAGYGLEISESYPSKLEKKLQGNDYNYTLINAGVSGDTSGNLLGRAHLYLAKNPEIVLLVIGGNDGLRGQSTDDMEKNIQAIIDLYKESSKIVLGGMDIPINFGLQYRNDFKQVYENLAKNNPEIYFQEFFLKDVAGDTILNQSDRIHPTSAGYDIVVENLYEFLEDEDIIQK